jgi:hypothetical protein
MASAVRKTIRLRGTRHVSRTRMPTANAMSVAIGMPQPEAVGVPTLRAA